MTRTMMDAYSVDALPEFGWDLLACYVNGQSTAQNYATARLRFPHAQILTITTDATMTEADVCDCEDGDYTPQMAAAWAAYEISKGRRPTVYSSRATWPNFVRALKSLGIASTEVDWWCSTLDGTQGPVFTLGGCTYRAVAVQYAQGGAGAYDVSIVYDDIWHPPTPPPNPQPPKPLAKDERMDIVTDGKTEFLVGGLEGARQDWWKHPLSPAASSAWANRLGITNADQIPNDPDLLGAINQTV